MIKRYKFHQRFGMRKNGPARFDLVLVLFLMMTSLFFYGCVTQQSTADKTKSQSLSQPSADVFNTENMSALSKIEYFDSGTFDRKLSSTLKQDPSEVTIDFIADVSLNDIPKRMDKWFSAVEKEEGVIDVQVDPDYRTRGIITEVISLAIGAYNFAEEKSTYNPAQNYNIKIYYIQGTGKITRAIFTHK